jgi:hypothetical protein
MEKEQTKRNVRVINNIIIILTEIDYVAKSNFMGYCLDVHFKSGAILNLKFEYKHEQSDYFNKLLSDLKELYS